MSVKSNLFVEMRITQVEPSNRIALFEWMIKRLNNRDCQILHYLWPARRIPSQIPHELFGFSRAGQGGQPHGPFGYFRQY